MSWIGVMVGVGIGATAGGGMSALNGGSTEDILKGALIGGTVGGVTGGAAGALAGPAAGGTAGGTAGAVTTPVVAPAVVAPAVGGTGGAGFAGLAGGTGITGGSGVLIGSTTGTLGTAGNAALASAIPNSVSTLGASAGSGAVGGAAGATPGGVLGSQAGNAANSVLPTAADISAETTAYNSANMGTQLLSDMTGANVAGNTGLQMAGGALQGSVTGAGINGLMAAAQGQDVGEAMGKGAILGGVGGGAAGGIGSLAGSGGYPGQLGNFVAAHPIAAPAVLSAGAGLALDSSPGTPEAPKIPGIQSDYHWDPDVYKPYRPMAQGGITDIDVQDPNQGDAIQLLADGGIVGTLMGQGVLGDLPGSNIVESVYDLGPGNLISPKIKEFLFGTPDKELTPDQRRKKAQIMQQEKLGDAGVPNVAQDIQAKGMAHGGIAEESYSLEGMSGREVRTGASADLREYLMGTPDSELSTAERRQKYVLSGKNMAHGGISHLGGYSDGGRLLKGPGDGVSDDIPAVIGNKEPARLAEGEFVVPARIVSELGNGSTDAGAKRLYAMMDRIQSERKKTTGKGKFSDNPKAYKHLPA